MRPSNGNSSSDPSIGLALAGGAPGGAIYEIGAMHALDEAIEGLDLNRCSAYVGVSAGAFLAACLANGLPTAKQCRAIVKREPGEHPFVPEIFFKPAVGELTRRIAKAPGLFFGALRDFVTRREKRLLEALTVLGQSLPVAVFDNEPVRDYVHRIFSIKGRTDDFNQLDRKLTVVTTDLESGQAQRFGHSGWMHTPISQAVQASTALPGLYPPVEINGRYYVDGILLKTMHASVALEAGAELVFCINPLVPVDTRKAVQENRFPIGEVIRHGLPSVLSQSVRTMIHSRMNLGLRAYDTHFPEADVILIEPPREDHEQFFSNIFSFAARRSGCKHAYEATRKSLLRRKDELAPVLERHGLRLDLDVLHDEGRDLWESVGLPEVAEEEASNAGKKAPVPPAEIRDLTVTRDLEELLDRVERLVERQRGGGAAAEVDPMVN
jgi:predicted acylesterase/phospholipase RssA